MRERHELEHGVVCERCLDIVYNKQYTRIQYSKPVVDDTTGRVKFISRMNLCNKCFGEYKNMIETFTGRKFEEHLISQKKEALLNLRNEMINVKNLQEDFVKIRKQ